VHVHLAAFLLAFLAPAPSAHAAARPVFCGLARTVNGFDYVRANGVACPTALRITVRIEGNERGSWLCARRVDGDVELACRSRAGEIDLLERSPVAARTHGGIVTLANWSFRLHGAFLQGRNARWWHSLGRRPWCVPDVPREVLLALKLRPVTPDGGCFTRVDR
jgi:hypothetical protein